MTVVSELSSVTVACKYSCKNYIFCSMGGTYTGRVFTPAFVNDSLSFTDHSEKIDVAKQKHGDAFVLPNNVMDCVNFKVLL
jgi:hypothetical protein